MRLGRWKLSDRGGTHYRLNVGVLIEDREAKVAVVRDEKDAWIMGEWPVERERKSSLRLSIWGLFERLTPKFLIILSMHIIGGGWMNMSMIDLNDRSDWIIFWWLCCWSHSRWWVDQPWHFHRSALRRIFGHWTLGVFGCRPGLAFSGPRR